MSDRAELERLRALKRQSENPRAELNRLRQLKAAQKPQGSVGEIATDFGMSVLSGATAEPLAGLAGIGRTVLDGGQAGADTVNNVRDSLTWEPRTQAYTDASERLGEFWSPLTNVVGEAAQSFTEGTGQVGAGLGSMSGNDTVEAAGYALGTALPGAVAAAFGVRGLPSVRAKREQKERVLEGDYDTDNTGLVDVGGKVKRDKLENSAVRQGIDPGVTAVIKSVSPKDRARMLRMVKTKQKGDKNRRFAALNRPADIPGESISNRLNHIRLVNKRAGKQLDIEAKKLKGQEVDYSPAVDQFIDSMADIGIRFKDGKADFSGSDIEGIDAAQGVLEHVIKRMRDTKTPDAYDVHRMKRFIDEHVSYGKSANGLTGRAEQIVKELRHNLDEVLDNQFDGYDSANQIYAETIGVIDDLQGIAGKKVDLSGQHGSKALGRLSRRILGNAQSREAVIQAIDDLDKLSAKHGGGFDDDIVSQVVFFNELNRRFGAAAPTSLHGDIEKVKGGRSAGGVLKDRVIDKAAEKMGFSNEAAYDALTALLRRQ